MKLDNNIGAPAFVFVVIKPRFRLENPLRDTSNLHETCNLKLRLFDGS